MGLTVAGRRRPLAGVVGGLAAPQIFLALGHQQRVTHVTVVKILEQQPLVEGGGARSQGRKQSLSSGGGGEGTPKIAGVRGQRGHPGALGAQRGCVSVAGLGALEPS